MWSEAATVPAYPRVAVCVPVRGRTEELERLMTALQAQEWPVGRYRVVVAIDGPNDRLRGVVERAGYEGFELPEPAGSYAARNAALTRIGTDTEFVLFTDADCIPSPTWIRAHVEALRSADLSGGAVRVTVRDRPTAAEIVDRSRHLRQREYVTQHGYAATANLAVHREVAELKFDQRLRTGGDAEFCRRAVTAGYKLVYTAGAAVDHPARRTARELMQKVIRLCRGILARRSEYAGRWIPRPRFRLELVRQAREEGVSSGPAWDARVLALNFVADASISFAVAAARFSADFSRRVSRRRSGRGPSPPRPN